MNSAINYYSAAQRHTDAIREARRRNPVLLRPVKEAPAPVSRGLGAVFARRLAWWPRAPRPATWF
jgi:hypothetical protein